MQRSETVIVVGIHPPAGLSRLLSLLQDHGYRVIVTPPTGELNDALANNPGAAIVAYEERGENTAHRVLDLIGGSHGNVPVIAVVEDGSFDEYYELMCNGAYDYFELREGPDVIERSLRGAGETVLGQTA